MTDTQRKETSLSLHDVLSTCVAGFMSRPIAGSPNEFADLTIKELTYFGFSISGSPSPASDADRIDAARYRYLRNRPEDTIGKGGVFAGMTPPTGKGGMIITEEDLDRHVDEAMAKEKS